MILSYDWHKRMRDVKERKRSFQPREDDHHTKRSCHVKREVLDNDSVRKKVKAIKEQEEKGRDEQTRKEMKHV